MPEDNNPISPVMPPVDTNVVPDYADNTSVSDAQAFENPAAVAAPEVSDVPTVVAPVVTDNSVAVAPGVDDSTTDGTEIYPEIVRKIRDAKNILVALSSDPSVDEMAAAIGLSLYLDRLGKRATAIYSGATPNALEFLKPEETFETTADSLQDFVIALDKEKADHLRYKVDGGFVKIYITPYKARIADSDLEFSYGDFNVDLVLALDVVNGIDLDSALREHGRIMHDASIINISTSKPGKFGEIEWSDKTASSVSEMIAGMLYSINSDVKIGKEEATAFLTGIVAATDRFSSSSTTPKTMQIASRLMESGANQQLISQNITSDVENELFSLSNRSSSMGGDPTKLEIDHDVDSDKAEKMEGGSQEVGGKIADKESTLLDDLKAAEESLAQASVETVKEPEREPLKINSDGNMVMASDEPDDVVSGVVPETVDAVAADIAEPRPEKKIQPDGDITNDIQDDTDKYGKMLEDALAGIREGDVDPVVVNEDNVNPATVNTPSVPASPEINGVPEMNYASSEPILPPPPPVDVSNVNFPTQGQGVDDATAMSLPPVEPIVPAVPPVEPTLNSLGAQPAMQDQVYNSQAADPGAFKIPNT